MTRKTLKGIHVILPCIIQSRNGDFLAFRSINAIKQFQHAALDAYTNGFAHISDPLSNVGNPGFVRYKPCAKRL